MTLKTTMRQNQVSSNPDDPGQVIRDLKTMIQAYRDAEWCHYGCRLQPYLRWLMHLPNNRS